MRDMGAGTAVALCGLMLLGGAPAAGDAQKGVVPEDVLSYQAFALATNAAVSTFTPTPIVLDTATLRR